VLSAALWKGVQQGPQQSSGRSEAQPIRSRICGAVMIVTGRLYAIDLIGFEHCAASTYGRAGGLGFLECRLNGMFCGQPLMAFG